MTDTIDDLPECGFMALPIGLGANIKGFLALLVDRQSGLLRGIAGTAFDVTGQANAPFPEYPEKPVQDVLQCSGSSW